MTMRRVDPKGLGNYLKRFLDQGNYRRLIGSRYFRATVVTVTNGSPTLCTLMREGEDAPDGGSYACATPGYRPSPGDDVLCMWVTASAAVVLWAANGLVLGARIYQTSVQATIATTVTADLILDTIDYDPHGLVSLVSPGTITIPVTGIWLVIGSVGWALANTPTDITIAANGIFIGIDARGANASGGGMGDRQQATYLGRLLQGDVIKCQVRQDSGGNAAPQAGNALTSMSVTFMGGI